MKNWQQDLSAQAETHQGRNTPRKPELSPEVMQRLKHEEIKRAIEALQPHVAAQMKEDAKQAARILLAEGIRPNSALTVFDSPMPSFSKPRASFLRSLVGDDEIGSPWDIRQSEKVRLAKSRWETEHGQEIAVWKICSNERTEYGGPSKDSLSFYTETAVDTFWLDSSGMVWETSYGGASSGPPEPPHDSRLAHSVIPNIEVEEQKVVLEWRQHLFDLAGTE